VFDPTVGTDWQTTSDSNAQVNQRHDIFNADQTWGVGGAISCADCHSPHSDNSTEPVSNPDTGNSLGTYNPANYGGGLDPSFNATEPDMIEFCTACHGEDKDPGTTTVWEGAGSSVMSTDLLQIGGAGGTYTADFHGTAFGGSGGNGFLKPPYTVDTAYAAMQCTDCHGAHGSPNIFNLKSSITINGTVMQTGGWDTGKAGDIGFKVTTNYDLADANGGTQDDHQWGAWCSFCHQMEAHGLAETKTCTGGHMHGGGKM
jgi:cytochrome c553